MMNELADKVEILKNKATKHIANDDYLSAQMLNLEMASLVWQHCESIVKALRFAADMEKLKSCGPEFALCVSGNYQIRVILHGKVRKFYGPDIYDAARKAVEELEKGE